MLWLWESPQGANEVLGAAGNVQVWSTIRVPLVELGSGVRARSAKGVNHLTLCAVMQQDLIPLNVGPRQGGFDHAERDLQRQTQTSSHLLTAGGKGVYLPGR